MDTEKNEAGGSKARGGLPEPETAEKKKKIIARRLACCVAELCKERRIMTGQEKIKESNG